MSKKWFVFFLSIFSIWVAMPSNASAASVRNWVARGNKAYTQQDYQKALDAYQKAEDKDNSSAIVHFNKGAAYYKQHDYDKAFESFSRALVTKNNDLEACTLYNIGNAKYRKGELIERNDIASALKVYKEALDYYTRTLQLKKQDKDAQFNKELVQERIKFLEEKMKKTPQKGSQQKESKGSSGEQQQSPQSKDSSALEKKDAQQSHASQGQSEKSQMQERQTSREEKKNGEEQQAFQEKPLSEKKSEGALEADTKKPKSGQQNSLITNNRNTQDKKEEMSEQEALVLLEQYREEEQRQGLPRQKTQTQGSTEQPIHNDW